ncbi:DNA-directed RNA polymerase sigma-70 factor [Bacteroidia bacterium]|nr:DNA-directed RNA polymerase sigma-70 factor [Bacteroidia bacterium]
MNLKELQWMENIKADDYESYNQLFRLYYPKLCLFVNKLINDNDSAEDIVQELFIKIWTNRKSIEIQTTASGYLFQTAKNMALNFIRDEANRTAILEKMRKEDSSLHDSLLADNGFSEELEDCIYRLPARCQEVLSMYHVAGYKQKEISEKLNISVQTIKNQLYNSLQRLRACLKLKGIMSR